MKRSGIERKTPLKRSPLPQQGTTREERPERAPVRSRGSRRDTGPSVEVRELVAARDGGRCLVCGGPGSNVHHRRNRGAGGSKHLWINSPANLMTVCGSGTTGDHGMITAPSGFGRTLLEMQALGYCLSTNGVVDPEDVAVCCFDGWHVLSHDGERVPAVRREFDPIKTDHETG